MVKAKKKTPKVNDENRISEVDKTHFALQFETKDNIIARLKASNVTLGKNVDKFKSKTNNLKMKLKDEYEYVEKILEEKINLEKILKMEIEDLLQETELMTETGIYKLKEKEDEFMREADTLKSITAVVEGRLNELEEFLKQENVLEKKYENMKAQIGIMNENYEMNLKKNEEKYYQNKKVVQREMFRRYNNFALDFKKQSMLDTDSSVNASTREVLNLKGTLKINEEQNKSLEKKLIDLREEMKCLLSSSKLNKKIIQENCDAYIMKKNKVKELRKELDELLSNMNKPQRISNKDESSTSRANKKLQSAVDVATRELQALNSEVNATQTELNNIRSNNRFDEHIWNMEDVLFRLHEEVVNHVEAIKFNEIDCKENINEFIQRLYEELKSAINKLQDSTLHPC